MKGTGSGAGCRFLLISSVTSFYFLLLWLLVFKLASMKVEGSRGGLDLESDGRDMNRLGSACSKDDIIIIQGQTAHLPDGIPTFTVQILNMCVSSCYISSIHVNCGSFSSARLINPAVFRRIRYGDCLVNDGNPLAPGQTLSFQYANTFPYPLSVTSVTCS